MNFMKKVVHTGLEKPEDRLDKGDKENVIPDTQIQTSRSQIDKAKSVSMLIIPKVRSINSKHVNRERTVKDKNNGYVIVPSQNGQQTVQRKLRMLTEETKSKTQLLTFGKNELMNQSVEQDPTPKTLMNTEVKPEIEFEY